MSWLALIPDHVRDRLSDMELDAYEDAGNETIGGPRLDGIITQVTALVRGKVASCRDNLAKLGPAGTIPEEALWAAATIARASLASSIDADQGGTEQRADELRQAHQLLDQIAACEIRIEDSTGSIPEAEDGGAGTYGGNALLDF